jgi:secondary thiamine-phosphate synthase enzyme
MTDFSRVTGSLYGMATGDALGAPTSFLTPSYIRGRWGWVDTFYPPEKGHIFHDGLQAGKYTDDTEQALALIKSFTRCGKVVPEDIVKEILAWAERVKDKYASPLGPSTERALKAIAAGVPSAVSYEQLVPVQRMYNKGITTVPKEDLEPNMIRAYTYQNQMVGMPVSCSAILLYYNRDMFRSVGLDPGKPPVTIAEMADAISGKKFLGYAPNNPLLIGVSNSGKVARLGEAIERVNQCGAFSLGLTGDPASLVGSKSQRIVHMEIPKFESAPGTRNYMVSLMALLLIAIRIGEVKGKYTMDTAKSYRKNIAAQADALETLLPLMDEKTLGLAKIWKDFPAYDFIGSGIDYATAWFGTAKVFEATGAFAASISLTVTSPWDPRGFEDIQDEISRLIPTRVDFKHQHDTPQDAAGHVKSALMGVSLTFIVDEGRLVLGSSQGIYFVEFDGPRKRQVYVKVSAD